MLDGALGVRPANAIGGGGDWVQLHATRGCGRNRHRGADCSPGGDHDLVHHHEAQAQGHHIKPLLVSGSTGAFVPKYDNLLGLQLLGAAALLPLEKLALVDAAKLLAIDLLLVITVDSFCEILPIISRWLFCSLIS